MSPYKQMNTSLLYLLYNIQFSDLKEKHTKTALILFLLVEQSFEAGFYCFIVGN